MSLLQKVKSEMGSPDWHVSMFDIHLRIIMWVYSCPGHAGVKGNARADRLAGKKTGGLRLGRCEVLRSLRQYLRAQSQLHHMNDRLGIERGVERGSAQRSSLRGRERAIVNQTYIGTVPKATLWIRETPERRVGAHMGFPECIDTILN